MHGLISVIIGALSFFIVLSILVFIHEMGHYSVARFFKVAVDRFSIGFGKPIVKWKAKSGTEWTFNRIPLGGYVKFAGDASAASNPDAEKLAKIKQEMDGKSGKGSWENCLHFKPLWQRALVVLAGPMANFILAVVLFAFVALIYGNGSLGAKVSAVEEGGAAEQAGFMVGDEFVSINGKNADEYAEVKQIVSLNSNESLNVTVKRAGRMVDLIVTPKRTAMRDGIGGKFEGGKIGVGFSNESYVHKTYNFGQASKYGVSSVWSSLASSGKYIGRIFKGKENGKALGGIVKIAAITGKVGIDSASVKGTFWQKLNIWFQSQLRRGARLSVGVGFANLMPIPVLDGGHLVFYGYEAIMRRPLSAKAQEIAFRVGFALLITLFLVLTWNDIGYVSDLFSKTG